MSEIKKTNEKKFEKISAGIGIFEVPVETGWGPCGNYKKVEDREIGVIQTCGNCRYCDKFRLAKGPYTPTKAKCHYSFVMQ